MLFLLHICKVFAVKKKKKTIVAHGRLSQISSKDIDYIWLEIEIYALYQYTQQHCKLKLRYDSGDKNVIII